MATIHYDYYDVNDEYSDGKIEHIILNFIHKYPDDYEKAFNENSSWPVIYHLSNYRKNIISWYPFKKNCSILEIGAETGAITDELCKHAKTVTSIELSKKNAEVIYERNKDKQNLEIIVGNYSNIKLRKKYDYILLNGVFEYAAMYQHTENPFVDFLNEVKKNLSKNGKILIAIENKYGLKYWNGADEDHTGTMFCGIKNYEIDSNIRTFSKDELNDLATTCGLKANFYYVFPDYKFPELIYTDASLNKNIYSNYIPYYSNPMALITKEHSLYREIYNNQMIPFFANSYFLELSEEKTPIEVEFVKFNNYRSKKYNLVTYLKDNKFYKKTIYTEASSQIENILNIQNKMLNNKMVFEKMIKENDEIYSNNVKGVNLNNHLIELYKKRDFTEIVNVFNKMLDYLKDHSGKKCKNQNTVFDKYNIPSFGSELEKLNFYEFGFIDSIPSNILVHNDKYILIDQEWFEKNVPIEYVLYRGIKNYANSISDNIYDFLIEKFELKPYEELFGNLEYHIFKDIYSDTYEIFKNYYNNFKIIDNIELLKTNYNIESINNQLLEIQKLHNQIQKKSNQLNNSNKTIKKLNDQLIDLSQEKQKLQNKINELNNDLSKVINSKGWKLLEKLRKIRKKIKNSDS